MRNALRKAIHIDLESVRDRKKVAGKNVECAYKIKRKESRNELVIPKLFLCNIFLSLFRSFYLIRKQSFCL